MLETAARTFFLHLEKHPTVQPDSTKGEIKPEQPFSRSRGGRGESRESRGDTESREPRKSWEKSGERRHRVGPETVLPTVVASCRSNRSPSSNQVQVHFA